MAATALGNLSGPAAEEAIGEATVLLQPVGAIEHHGPHLPLATDTIVADALGKAVVASHPELDLLLLPTLSYGLSSEHVWAPGTVTMSVATMLAVLDDVAASAVRAGAGRLALLNGHGGNTHILRVACRELRVRYGLRTFLLHASLAPDNGGPPSDPREEGLGIHGGLGETSTMLYLAPELVDMDKAVRSVPSWLNDHERIGFNKTADPAWLSNDLTPTGVAGDPTLATADLGKERFEAGVADLGAALADVSRFRFPHEIGGTPT